MDIRIYKNELRAKYKSIRFNMSNEEKSLLDEKIYSKLCSLISYKSCKTVFIYVSTPIEVDTRRFIMKALSDGKTVAVPRCISGTRNMSFHVIKSLDELEKGAFSVDEPIDNPKMVITDYNQSICIVPALCFDKSGFRLGYGKGYYDRFLSKYTGAVIGICYSNCITNSLITGRYDRKCDVVVTDKGVYLN